MVLNTWLAGMLLLAQANAGSDLVKVTLFDKLVHVVSVNEYVLPFSADLPIIDPDKVSKLTRTISKRVFTEPINAAYDESGKLNPERNGLQLDRFSFEQAVYSRLYGETTGDVKVPTMQILPRVDRRLLKQLTEKRIGSYTTYYNHRNENRNHNIFLSAMAIDSHVVFPGEIFSFNQVVGQRTREKGYREAPEIVRGEMSEGIGGGICQTSSTLFNAVDRAGLHIVQRYSHSRNVQYVPPGRDATVSWYGPDFRFQNKYAYPILVRSYARNGQITVSIYSFEEIEYDPRTVP